MIQHVQQLWNFYGANKLLKTLQVVLLCFAARSSVATEFLGRELRISTEMPLVPWLWNGAEFFQNKLKLDTAIHCWGMDNLQLHNIFCQISWAVLLERLSCSGVSAWNGQKHLFWITYRFRVGFQVSHLDTR